MKGRCFSRAAPAAGDDVSPVTEESELLSSPRSTAATMAAAAGDEEAYGLINSSAPPSTSGCWGSRGSRGGGGGRHFEYSIMDSPILAESCYRRRDQGRSQHHFFLRQSRWPTIDNFILHPELFCRHSHGWDLFTKLSLSNSEHYSFGGPHTHSGPHGSGGPHSHATAFFAAGLYT